MPVLIALAELANSLLFATNLSCLKLGGSLNKDCLFIADALTP